MQSFIENMINKNTSDHIQDTRWDFVGETANGIEDIWWILEGQDYPRLWWETPSN